MSAPAAAVDPRIRARRVAVMRAQGRRRLHVLAGAAGVVLVVAAGWGVSRTPLLDVDRITVTGADPARRAEIIEGSALSTGLPMLFLDVEKAERSVASLPWVRGARVWRDWPATVRIAVEPRLPAALVPASEGRAAMLDAYGYAIGWAPARAAPGGPDGGADTERPPASTLAVSGLPHVSVPFDGRLGDLHTSADGPLALVAAMPDDLRAWVGTVTLDPGRGRLGLELVGGAEVVLGEPVLLEDKVSALRAVLAGADLECVTEIDVTMPEIATVTRRPSCHS